MTRYLTKAAVWRAPIVQEEAVFESKSPGAHPAVFEFEEKIIDTGLYNSHGDRIFRDDSNPIGFIRG
jgi:hypothetical protein